MSLSAEEQEAIRAAWNAYLLRPNNPYVSDQEAIWLAAKNWALEKAAKACEAETLIRYREGRSRYAEMIRRLKDQHG